jgi:translocation protein SEC63
MDNLPFSLCQL